MTLDRRAIRAAALEQMQTATPRPLYEGLLYTLCSAALLFLAGQIFSSRLELDDLYQYLSYFNAENINTISYAQALKLVEKMQPTTTEYLFSMGLQLFQSFVSAGFSLFALRSLRREETCSLWNLFDSFGVFLPLLLVLILKRLLLTLWLQLLIIPGLIAFYRYRLAVYLVLDHPSLGGFRADARAQGAAPAARFELRGLVFPVDATLRPLGPDPEPSRPNSRRARLRRALRRAGDLSPSELRDLLRADLPGCGAEI